MKKKSSQISSYELARIFPQMADIYSMPKEIVHSHNFRQDIHDEESVILSHLPPKQGR